MEHANARSWRDRFRDWLSPLVLLSNNWISLIGVVVTTTSAVLWILLVPALFVSHAENPYAGILGFVLLPAAFAAGLILIPAGIGIRKFLLRKRGQTDTSFPPLTISNPALRKLLGFIAVTTLANIVIAGTGGYTAVHYMETNSFCGLTCHTVMSPQYTAHKSGGHAEVNCVQCHVGSGATGFVNAKKNGASQLVSLARGTFERPVTMPARVLLPARETCRSCHSLPNQSAGGPREDTLRVIQKFRDDQRYSPVTTALLMHSGAIHRAHLGGTRVQYSADEKFEKITALERTRGPETLVYTLPGTNPGRSPLREMDCMDCHNRPAHGFESAERAVDQAMLNGAISRELPFAKKQGVEILKREYASREEAAVAIPQAFAGYYRQSRADVYAQRKAQIESAGAALAAIYARNIFPEMKVDWGTYPNFLGHNDAPGCFRCHGSDLKPASGATIGQDCNTCHNLLAMDEASPAILKDLGIERK